MTMMTVKAVAVTMTMNTTMLLLLLIMTTTMMMMMTAMVIQVLVALVNVSATRQHLGFNSPSSTYCDIHSIMMMMATTNTRTTTMMIQFILVGLVNVWTE